VLAEKQGIPVLQFQRIKAPEGVAALKELAPDLIVTAAFGQILSKEILDIPPMGCINVHASLLPQYRGAAPIQWVIITG
jgi:methionyl-tRNA formyltransferase